MHKAGCIVNMVDDNGYKFLFMVPSNPMYGGVKPQIAKGVVNKNEDIKAAALRETAEELGLVYRNIKSVTYIGKEKIVTGNGSYHLHLYGVEVFNDKDFKAPHYETGKRVWLREHQIDKVRSSQKNAIKRAIDMVKRSKL